MPASTSPPAIVSSRLVVGMEIHVELATRTKMFTRIANVAHPAHCDEPPNTLIDPVVLALPGALPVMNRRAVELSVLVGLALGCEISSYATWDRKNYFYPDLPKGFQISQFSAPLCGPGAMEITAHDGSSRQIRINRAHLEEDAGKLGHELPGGHHYAGSLVDFNRAGTPLLEIVTEPDFDHPDDVVTFAQELRAICTFIGATEGDMQRGHMRFEPNINMVLELDTGATVRTPIVEIKNLNSFRAVKGAIEHEMVRQVKQWREDGVEAGPNMKSTRGWNDERGETFLQRAKEDAMDYRYFPEPDLPPVVVDAEWKAAIGAMLPELPAERRARYARDFALNDAECAALLDDRALCGFFEDSVQAAASMAPAGEVGGAIAKMLLNLGAKRANERGVAIHELGITAAQVAQIVAMRQDNSIGSSAADTLFGLLCETDEDAEDVARREALLQVKDDGQLESWIESAIANDASSAGDFANGKDAAAGRLIGAIMKLSNGQADAAAVRAKLVSRLRP